jgi:hypothetical protein
MAINPQTIQNVRKVAMVTVITGAIVAAIGFSIFAWYNATHLRVSATRPNTKIGATSTNIIFWFNKPIAADVAKNFSISPKIEGTTTVKGTAVIFSPNDVLTEGKTYTATLSSATSADGKFHTGEKKIVFKGGFVDATKLSEDVRKRALLQTDDKPSDLGFAGEAGLLNQGVTSDQLINMENSLNKYFHSLPKPKTSDYSAIIGEVTSQPYDINVPVTTYTFDITISGTVYHAQLDCTSLSGMRVTLTNQQGAQVFDSGIVDTEQGND